MNKATSASRRGFAQRVIKTLASLKLAVVIILGIAAATAWGTIVESQLNAAAAQKIVYHSIWMYGILGLLCVSLIAVMVDRWPWKKRHTGFILAHIGIIILILGSIITRYFGIDGSVNIQVGESNRYVLVSETDFTVYTSFDGTSYAKVYDRPVDFFTNPPRPDRPHSISLPDATLEIVDYIPYALREQKIVEGDPKIDGPALRFQLQNPNVNMTEWVMQPGPGRPGVQDLGPAKVVITTDSYDTSGQNVIVLKPLPDGESLEYAIHSRREAAAAAGPRKGIAKAGDVIETGWMGLVLRVLKYIPHAREDVVFHRKDVPTELTQEAFKVRFNGQERWASINSLLKLFTDQSVYIVAYANRRIDLAKAMNDATFDIKLKKFEVGRYQGTMRAASYQSLVTVPGRGDVLISMNEPLKHNGFTFYQASFQQDENGRPTASVLSVNRDPGRWIKYLGSLLIVFGAIHLFYFKKMAARQKKAAAQAVS